MCVCMGKKGDKESEKDMTEIMRDKERLNYIIKVGMFLKAIFFSLISSKLCKHYKILLQLQGKMIFCI